MLKQLVISVVLFLFCTCFLSSLNSYGQPQTKLCIDPEEQHSNEPMESVQRSTENRVPIKEGGESRKEPNKSPQGICTIGEQLPSNVPPTAPEKVKANALKQEPKEHTEGDHKKSEGKPFWKDYTALTALFTLFLAIGTLVLACVATYQGYLLRKDLILTQRPRLRVRNIVVKSCDSDMRQCKPLLGPVNPDTAFTGQFYVANVGSTDATITEIGCWLFWTTSPLPMKRPYEGEPGNISPDGFSSRMPMKPGQSIEVQIPCSAKIVDKPFSSWVSCCIYVMGWIEYADDLGIKRRTTYCQKLSNHRFSKVEDPDYEQEE